MTTITAVAAKGGRIRAKRLTPERMREIAELGGLCSVTVRRDRRERARAQAACLNANSSLSIFSPKEREQLIYHADAIERIILSRQARTEEADV